MKQCNFITNIQKANKSRGYKVKDKNGSVIMTMILPQ
jgi:hypothetical protein